MHTPPKIVVWFVATCNVLYIQLNIAHDHHFLFHLAFQQHTQAAMLCWSRPSHKFSLDISHSFFHIFFCKKKNCHLTRTHNYMSSSIASPALLFVVWQVTSYFKISFQYNFADKFREFELQARIRLPAKNIKVVCARNLFSWGLLRCLNFIMHENFWWSFYARFHGVIDY